MDAKVSIISKTFADDIIIMAPSDNDIIRAEELLNEFCKHSGASVNKEKSMLMGLGRWKNRKTWPISLLKTGEYLNLLGIPFENDVDKVITKVWTEARNHLIRLLHENYYRRLTIFQRANFVKTFALYLDVCTLLRFFSVQKQLPRILMQPYLGW